MIPVVLLLAPAPDAQAERQKIEALILAVAQLKGAVFIRNGTEHTPQQAADHLRLKWGNAGSRVKTAQDFIRGCGTKSSFSGKPYRLCYADGHESSCADFLWTELKKLDDTIK